MHYDFQTLPQRRGTGSAKWELMYREQPDLGPDVVPLSVADMEFENPPEVKQALREWLDGAVMGYTDPTDEFFSACLGWQERRHGWTPEREWVVTSPGVVPAIFNAVRTLTSPGDGVIVQPPVYYPFFMAVETSGRRIVRNPLAVDRTGGTPRYRMDFDDLERKASNPANTMLVLCSPHNPVGRVWTRRELERVLDICARHDVTIVADEIHDDLIMPGHEHTAFMSVADVGEYDHVLVATAPSKTFNIAGCQASAIFIPNDDVRDRFRKGLDLVPASELNCFAYPATIAAYTKCDDWLEELIQVVSANFDFLRGFMGTYLPELVVYPMEGTYLAWVDFNAWGLSTKELQSFMEKDALLFLDEGYVFGEEGAGFERFNLACPRDVLEESLERLVHAAKERRL
ncbi:MAG: pyridoxal phosphate-dependent aminotransferase, partial [Parafannyhessea umbonata]|uniref:MalY/PatB family protein n=2 Tax=Parafannyhessea umbonata TaxID=604330 RepID=UPI0026F06057